MKSVAFLTMLSLLALPCLGGLPVQTIKIDVLESNGFTAAYNAGASTLTWSGGASVSLYSSEAGTGDPIQTISNGITFNAAFTIVNDMSSGGVAKASFAAIDWSVKYFGNDVLCGTHKTGELFVEEEQYTEFFGNYFYDGLWGSGIVTVVGDGLSQFDASYSWFDNNSDARLKSHVIVDEDFDDYDTDSYSTVNTTAWLYADETVIPEPATLALLGLGAAVVAMKRR